MKRKTTTLDSEAEGNASGSRKRSKVTSQLYFPKAAPPPVTITLREVEYCPTPVFDTFWRLAAERHAIDVRRRAGLPPPWTQDPILEKYKFCNTYRVLDRVSQYIITEVIRNGSDVFEEITFRVVLFSLFTSIRTYEALRKNIKSLTWSSYKRAQYEKVLRGMYNKGMSIYTGAYQKPAPELGFAENFMNHLAFLEVLMHELPDQLRNAEYMMDVFEYLRTFKSMGDFSAYQLVLNLSYSNVINFSEYDMVVIGIGSRRGLRRCFSTVIPRAAEVDIVRWMQVSQWQHFGRLGIEFNGLGAERQSMMLCDIEHTLCELDKYIRKYTDATPGRPFGPTGQLDKVQLPDAWSHEDRKHLRIKPKGEAEVEILEKYVVEAIKGHRMVNGVREFHVSWEGYPEEEATWEPEPSLRDDAPVIVLEYLSSIKGIAYP